MLPEEAAWIEAHLLKLGAPHLSPLLNLGSGNQRFRDEEQPFIGALWRGFVAKGGRVIHADLRAQPGVDLVGDLHDPAVQARLRTLGPATLLASNLLEHVADPAEMAALLEHLTPPGGHLIVTGPLVFPFHPDPIDNGLRMTPQQAAAMFPGLRVVEAATIESPQHMALGRAQHAARGTWRRLVRRLYWMKQGLLSAQSRRVQWSHWRHRHRVPTAFAIVLRKDPA